jgi:undecaprenyl diphosphate synthase
MMWDVKDAQLYFTKTLWPAFSVKELKEALQLYSDTERRLGK